MNLKCINFGSNSVKTFLFYFFMLYKMQQHSDVVSVVFYVFEISLLGAPRLHLLSQKYSENSSIVKYYNLKQLLSILMYFI